MMKHSVRLQHTLLLAGMLASITLLLFLVITFGLEPYAVRNKRDDVKTAIPLVIGYINHQDTGAEQRLNMMAAKGNLGIGIYDLTSYAPHSVYSSNYNLDTVTNRFKSYMMGESIVADEIFERTDDYVLYRIFDNRMSGDQIECMGVYNRHAYFITTSMAGVQASVGITGNFLLMVGGAGLILGAVLIYALSKRFTAPIVSLAKLSEQISDLDFSGKYEGREENEIGTLGNNMNLMSERLSSTITELRQANSQLEKDIEEKNKIDENRRELIANISHELKTPIALIQGFSEGLKDGIADGDKENMDYYCDVIIDEAEKMNRLVKRLLALDEIESGISKPEMVEFNLMDVIKGVMQASAMLSRDKGVSVKLLAPEQLMVEADEFMIEEVIQNLLSNACHYVSSPGEITVRAWLTPEQMAHVAIHNTGEEIPEEALSRLWEKFYKVDKARTRSYGGSGIGLSIVKGIITRHEGACGVINTGDGVEFWFEIRALPDRSPESGRSEE